MSSKALINEYLHSGFFLASTIIFTAALVFLLVMMLFGGTMGILIGIVPLGFMLISAIFMWKTYLTDKETASEKGIRCIFIFDGFQRILSAVCTAVMCMVAIVVFYKFRTGGNNADCVGQTAHTIALFFGKQGELCLDWRTQIAFVADIIPICLTLTLGYVCRLHNQRRAMYRAIAKAADGSAYYCEKASATGSCIVGGVFAAAANVVAFTGPIRSFLTGGVNLRLVIFYIFCMLMCLYYVFSGIWMRKVHLAAMTNMAQETVPKS